MRSDFVSGALILNFSLLQFTSAVAGTNLLRNGSFERPVVPDGGYVTVANGEKTIPGWSVVGAQGNVAPISGNFTQDGYRFPAKAGAQWIDLTGVSNTATGIQQTAVTAPGASYDLTFFVGNVSGDIFGSTSTVKVYVNGALALSAVNSSGTKDQVWKKFVTTITAESSRTSIRFINGDPSSDNTNGLDAVSLVPHTTRADGEPGTEPSLFNP